MSTEEINKSILIFVQIITARHCDITAFAVSLITNKCVSEYESQEEVGHEDVVEVGKQRQFVLGEFVSRLVTRIARNK